MRLELPSPDPNVAPPPMINRRARYADQRPGPGSRVAQSGSYRPFRALPWIVVGLWAGAMLLGVYAEYLISSAFR